MTAETLNANDILEKWLPAARAFARAHKARDDGTFLKFSVVTLQLGKNMLTVQPHLETREVQKKLRRLHAILREERKGIKPTHGVCYISGNQIKASAEAKLVLEKRLLQHHGAAPEEHFRNLVRFVASEILLSQAVKQELIKEEKNFRSGINRRIKALCRMFASSL